MFKTKSPKIYVPVKGGLGNQMFFYAFKVYLKHNGLDSSFVWHEFIFTKQHNGVELLNTFDIKQDQYAKNLISLFLWINKLTIPLLFKRIVGKFFQMRYLLVRKFRQKTPYSYDLIPKKFDSSAIYMDGFWQNYQYLTAIRPELLNSFKFKLPVANNHEGYLKQINDTHSVSIHIRRGDYLHAQFASLNIIKSLDYYLDSISYLKEKHQDLVFFIFTDDVKWAKDNFNTEPFVFVEGNQNNESYIDMYLMSKCKHNIIANSTFSWWAAWLNESPTKTVIVPKKWTENVLSAKLCPPDWVFIEV